MHPFCLLARSPSSLQFAHHRHWRSLSLSQSPLIVSTGRRRLPHFSSLSPLSLVISLTFRLSALSLRSSTSLLSPFSPVVSLTFLLSLLSRRYLPLPAVSISLVVIYHFRFLVKRLKFILVIDWMNFSMFKCLVCHLQTQEVFSVLFSLCVRVSVFWAIHWLLFLSLSLCSTHSKMFIQQT